LDATGGGGAPGVDALVLADLTLRQRRPLSSLGRDTQWAHPILPPEDVVVDPEALDMTTLIKEYHERNCKLF